MSRDITEWRGQDLNLRPSGYERSVGQHEPFRPRHRCTAHRRSASARSRNSSFPNPLARHTRSRQRSASARRRFGVSAAIGTGLALRAVLGRPAATTVATTICVQVGTSTPKLERWPDSWGRPARRGTLRRAFTGGPHHERTRQRRSQLAGRRITRRGLCRCRHLAAKTLRGLGSSLRLRDGASPSRP